jgi:hypothetical protein
VIFHWPSSHFLLHIIREEPASALRFPICEEEGITGEYWFELSEEEISAGTESLAHEMALNADLQVRFRIEF